MDVLPIAGRELTVASRRTGTYRVRLMAAVLAFFTGASFILFSHFTGRGSSGQNLFGILKVGAFGFCLFAGVFLTADSLSEEKREGTLGLLFLTELRGFDVVLGKLASSSLGALYGLLAIFPVMALTLSMGGVTDGEFWRTALVLLNTLFLSLAVGLLVSSGFRDYSATFGVAFGACLALVTILPAVSVLGSSLPLLNWLSWVGVLPAFRFASDGFYQRHTVEFWGSIGAGQVMAWVCLVGASYLLPRRWQDTPAAQPGPVRSFRLSSEKRLPVRRELLDIHPILALTEAGASFKLLIWAAVVLGVAGSGFLSYRFIGLSALGSSIPTVFGGLIKIFFASMACRFFVESRRGGALELLLSTPLPDNEILAGQRFALKRAFFWPSVVFCVVPVCFVLASYYHTILNDGNWPGMGVLFIPLAMLYRTAVYVLDLLMLTWLGMWFGLTYKRPNLAVARVVFAGIILPKFIFIVPDFLYSLGLLWWARRKFKPGLRNIVEAQSQSGIGRLPPPIRRK